MDRGIFQSSPVQQMMGGNPNWWNMSSMKPPPQQTSPLMPSSFSSPSSSSSSSFVFPQYPQPSTFIPMNPWYDNEDLPESWSQLLLGGLVGEEERCNFTPFPTKKMENWEDKMIYYSSASAHVVDVKQESPESEYLYGRGNEETQAVIRSSWDQILPGSSTKSCVTTSFLDFSNRKAERKHHQPDHSSDQSNSTASGSAFKKARVQATSSAHSTIKVRKEKLGDRITTLHQLVSPFGKTDTASVLGETIGYIRFLQDQVEALSSPYLGNGSGSMTQSLVNDTCNKRRGPVPEQDIDDGPKKDLRSRGLCLVPISCISNVGSDNGADYWAPTLGSRGF